MMQSGITTTTSSSTATAAHTCYHCGNDCNGAPFVLDDKDFCCAGCMGVYEILSTNNLCNYYRYNDAPGKTQKVSKEHFEYLDEPSIISQLVDFTDQQVTVITFYIPSIHCSSCIWLLEHLHKLNPGVLHSRIDFLKKEVVVTFRHQEISLRQLVELLASISYEPAISLQDVVKERKNAGNRDLIKKIAVAGFCMGNVMLFSFPEYLGLSSYEQRFKILFSFLNLAFAIPVTFYCAREFFTSAWSALKKKVVNLDAPLALIVAVLFLRTAYEILTRTGPGFTDTLTGLVFLLLMGRWVKQRSYNHFSFDRDYRSYFPVAITAIRQGKEKPVAINELVVGDRILIRNNEIVPADSILMKGEAYIDFSFVTGETDPVEKVLGEVVYAGGRQRGEVIELEVVKAVSQSYLTRLWNNEAFRERTGDRKLVSFNDRIARYFSLAVFVVAFGSAGYWQITGDPGKAWAAFTAVLIVACPCVISLSTPFTLSAVLGLFDRNKFYLKNTDVVEQLARISTIVFDKTGTITSPEAANLDFSGELSGRQKLLVASLARNSMHPMSREIVKWLKADRFYDVADFKEVTGKGICGLVEHQEIVMGNPEFVLGVDGGTNESSSVYLRIDGEYLGYFRVRQQWRKGLRSLIDKLAAGYDLHLISGDWPMDAADLAPVFPASAPVRFRQGPQDKLDYIERLQGAGKRVMMIGDGLNDAGALKQSELGVAVSDDSNNFNPACDAILQGESLNKLPQFIGLAKGAVKTIRQSFVIATAYNLIGVTFAVQGILSPLTAAVLMPLSTVTIIAFTSVAVRYQARKNQLK